MRWLPLILFAAAGWLHGADDLLHVPSPADVEAHVPAKPPVYAEEGIDRAGTKTGCSQPNNWNISPDGTHFTVISHKADDVWIWRPELRQGVFLVGELDPNFQDYNSADPRNNMISYVRYDLPRLVAHSAWSPDSQYVVMTTTDPGGHSPWHFAAFVYSVKTRTLRAMDPVIGDVISPSFNFVGPHTVEMSLAPTSRDFSRPLKVKVDLDQKFLSMPKQKGRMSGRLDN